MAINKKESATTTSRPEGEFNDSSKPKEYYQTEKFGSYLLMNSDSHTAIAAAKLSGDEVLNSQGALMN